MDSGNVARAARSATRFVTALAVAMMLVLGGSAVGGHAADSYDTQAYLTDAHFTEATIESYGRAELNLTWAMPNNPNGDVGMIIDLPDGLRGLNVTFDVVAGDGVTVIGEAVITDGQLNVDFDDDYFDRYPINITGTLSLWVEFTLEYDDIVEETFVFGPEIRPSIIIDGRPAECGDYCTFTGTPGFKQGFADIDYNALRWDIVVPVPAEGMTAGQRITVTDHLGPNQVGSSYKLRKTNEFVTYDDGSLAPGNWVEMEDDEFTFDAETLTWEWTAEGGYYYVISATTRPTDGWASVTYRNDATIIIAGEEPVSVGVDVRGHGGLGSGSGNENPILTLVKNVAGGPAEATDWLLQADPQDIAGQPLVSGYGGFERIPVAPGDYVLSESDDGPAGYLAGEWTCTGAELNGDTVTVTVDYGDDAVCQITNTYSLGSLTWSKVAAGSGVPLAGSQWDLTGPEGTVVVVVDNTGQADYEGLDLDNRPGEFLVEVVESGVWQLAETKAPAGFTSTDESFDVTVANGEIADFGDIENHQASALAMPAAGAVGLVGVWLGGAALVAAAFVVDRRRRSQTPLRRNRSALRNRPTGGT